MLIRLPFRGGVGSDWTARLDAAAAEAPAARAALLRLALFEDAASPRALGGLKTVAAETDGFEPADADPEAREARVDDALDALEAEGLLGVEPTPGCDGRPLYTLDAALRAALIDDAARSGGLHAAIDAAARDLCDALYLTAADRDGLTEDERRLDGELALHLGALIDLAERRAPALVSVGWLTLAAGDLAALAGDGATVRIRAEQALATARALVEEDPSVEERRAVLALALMARDDVVDAACAEDVARGEAWLGAAIGIWRDLTQSDQRNPMRPRHLMCAASRRGRRRDALGDDVGALADVRLEVSAARAYAEREDDAQSATDLVIALGNLGLVEPDPATAAAALEEALRISDAALERFAEIGDGFRVVADAACRLAERRANELDDLDGARAAHEAAVLWRRRAMAARPGDLSRLEALSDALDDAADAEAEQAGGETADTLALRREAVDLMRAMIAADPADAAGVEFTAWLQAQFATALDACGDTPGAVAHFSESAALRRRRYVAATAPDLELENGLAASLSGLALALEKLGALAASRSAAREELMLSANVMRRAPENVEYALDVVRCLWRLADLEDDPRERRRLARDAFEIVERLSDAGALPDDVDGDVDYRASAGDRLAALAAEGAA